MEKDSEGREEEPSAPDLKVTDCFPSETVETLSFLSRPNDGGGRGGEGLMPSGRLANGRFSSWEHHLQSVKGESGTIVIGFT